MAVATHSVIVKLLVEAALVWTAYAIYRVATRQHDREHMSERWLEAQKRRTSRDGFDGPSVRWPINKVVNEYAAWNTHRAAETRLETKKAAAANSGHKETNR